MTAIPSPAQSQPKESSSDLRGSVRSWNFFRFVLGFVGAAFVLFPLTSGNNYVLSLIGLVMFVTAILLPRTKPQTRVDVKARELGAIAVVNGGRIRFKNSSSSVRVRLFVCWERISVLDANLHMLFEIPAPEIVSAQVVQAEKRWVLELKWTTHTANFFYRGIFAGHLARAAEGTIRRVMRPTVAPPVQRRAASA